MISVRFLTSSRTIWSSASAGVDLAFASLRGAGAVSGGACAKAGVQAKSSARPTGRAVVTGMVGRLRDEDGVKRGEALSRGRRFAATRGGGIS